MGVKGGGKATCAQHKSFSNLVDEREGIIWLRLAPSFVGIGKTVLVAQHWLPVLWAVHRAVVEYVGVEGEKIKSMRLYDVLKGKFHQQVPKVKRPKIHQIKTIMWMELVDSLSRPVDISFWLENFGPLAWFFTHPRDFWPFETYCSLRLINTLSRINSQSLENASA